MVRQIILFVCTLVRLLTRIDSLDYRARKTLFYAYCYGLCLPILVSNRRLADCSRL